VTLKVPSVIMVREYVHFDRAIPWNEDYLKLRDRFRCQYCNRQFPAQQLTQDHVIPRMMGGKTSWDNIVSACGPCNHSRGHNTKIKPRITPYKPSYWELVEKAKELAPAGGSG
jgi:5-methylcytosine-specific restriction endonuclease McrA